MTDKKPVEWSEILPDKIPENVGFNSAISLCEARLKIAERSGLICRNVPDENAIWQMINEFVPHKWRTDGTSMFYIDELSKAISARLRGE
jgi:hypothetical protein